MNLSISRPSGELVIILHNNKRRWYYSWRWKLFFVFTFISFVPIIFFYNTMLASMMDYYQTDRETKLQSSANIVAGSIKNANYLFDELRRPLFDEEIKDRSKEGVFRVLVLDHKGMVINDSNFSEIGKTYLVPEVMQAFQKNNKVVTRVDEKTIYAAAAIQNEASETVGAVLLVSSIEDIFEAIEEIEQKLVLFTILIMLLLVVLVFFMSQFLLDPLRRFLKVVQKMAEGHLNERITIKGHDEFSELGDAFNNMAEKLERAENTREEFVSNVSHELKTPLSSIKVLTEAILLEENVPIEMYTEFLQDINSEIDRMTYIINDLLTLVRLDQRELAINIRETDINKMVEDILKRLYPLSEQKEIELLYADVRKVIIDADEMKLSLAISNLVENGIKYTPNGGTVKVIVDSDHQNAFITVQDTGIGITDDDQGKVFNRFYRVDKTRDRETGGTGLGLAITRSTVLLHNGSIRINSKENEGTTFVVRIPIHCNE